MIKKRCSNCKHFNWLPTEAFEGDNGPFIVGGFDCNKGYFCEEIPKNNSAYLHLISDAEKCKDYTHVL